MKETGNPQINDTLFWDGVYEAELGSGKRRIDNERWDYLAETMKEAQTRTPDIGQLLDVGCGNGEMMRLIHAILPDWKLTGIDITPKILAWARNVDPLFNYQVMPATEITLERDFYDVVFCGETLEHLDNPELAIEQMFKVLKPTGRLVCSVPNEGNNRSPEHLREFTVFDALKMTTVGDMTRLVDVNVKCNGISTIWTTKK